MVSALDLQSKAPFAGRIISISSTDGENFESLLGLPESKNGILCYLRTARVGFTPDKTSLERRHYNAHASYVVNNSYEAFPIQEVPVYRV